MWINKCGDFLIVVPLYLLSTSALILVFGSFSCLLVLVKYTGASSIDVHKAAGDHGAVEDTLLEMLVTKSQECSLKS